jgi:hypothetical protein
MGETVGVVGVDDQCPKCNLIKPIYRIDSVQNPNIPQKPDQIYQD